MGEHFPFRLEEAALKDIDNCFHAKNIFCFRGHYRTLLLLFNITQQNKKSTSTSLANIFTAEHFVYQSETKYIPHEVTSVLLQVPVVLIN